MLLPSLIVHGGAGAAHPELQAAQAPGCRDALETGWRLLMGGAGALDAVCAAVARLEDDPAFNAGVGSCLTAEGSVEMDASVMDGSTLRAGAVAVVSRVRHPIELARAIMEDGRHVLLAGCGAETMARSCGLALCEPKELVTARQHELWKQRSAAGATGTVGAVAVDRRGHVAAATSTGGLFYKLPGRIGDSAVIGAGTFADDTLGAASATGQGEAILRVALAKTVTDALGHGNDPMVASHLGIRVLRERTGAAAGIIVVDRFGRIGHSHNTERLTLAYMRSDLSAPVVSI